MNPSLGGCLDIALHDCIVLLGQKAGLSREDAYRLRGLAVGLRVTQTVNKQRGVHAMVAKLLLGAAS
jgi:acetamidase/formamidase